MAIRQITKITEDTFTIDTFGLYAVSITARCKSGKQTGMKGGENLRIEIDDVKLREIPPLDNKQYFDIPSTWNGTDLKGLAKTIIFLLSLNKGDHTLTFIPNPSATIESYAITPIQDPQNISFDFNAQAEDGDKRPWYTFALIDLPLQFTSADITVAWHSLDGDDVKLMFDGDIMEHLKSKRWKNWIWHAEPKQTFSGVKREKKEFSKQLSKGIHYIEFWADKTPILHNITLNLGDYTPKWVPTVNDPKWTGDFGDDTEQMLLARLILGEMEGQSSRAKIGAGFTVLNRLKKKRSNWGYSLHDVILKENQYDAFWNEDTIQKVRDPLSHTPQDEWEECYDIAVQVLAGDLTDPVSGATNFFSKTPNNNFPDWADDDVYKKKIDITYFYELDR